MNSYLIHKYFYLKAIELQLNSFESDYCMKYGAQMATFYNKALLEQQQIFF